MLENKKGSLILVSVEKLCVVITTMFPFHNSKPSVRIITFNRFSVRSTAKPCCHNIFCRAISIGNIFCNTYSSFRPEAFISNTKIVMIDFCFFDHIEGMFNSVSRCVLLISLKWLKIERGSVCIYDSKNLIGHLPISFIC